MSKLKGLSFRTNNEVASCLRQAPMRQRLESGCFGCQPTGAQGARAGDWEPKRPTVSQQLVREWKPKVRDGLNETNETTRSCEVGLLRCHGLHKCLQWSTILLSERIQPNHPAPQLCVKCSETHDQRRSQLPSSKVLIGGLYFAWVQAEQGRPCQTQTDSPRQERFGLKD